MCINERQEWSIMMFARILRGYDNILDRIAWGLHDGPGDELLSRDNLESPNEIARVMVTQWESGSERPEEILQDLETDAPGIVEALRNRMVGVGYPSDWPQ